MRIDVLNLMRLNARVANRVPHHAETAIAVFARGGDVVRIARHAVADHLGKDCRTALFRVLVLFQNQDARAFANDEPIAVFVPGA